MCVDLRVVRCCSGVCRGHTQQEIHVPKIEEKRGMEQNVRENVNVLRQCEQRPHVIVAKGVVNHVEHCGDNQCRVVGSHHHLFHAQTVRSSRARALATHIV